MADGFKIKFDYTSPANIEALVPEEQKLRENPPENIERDENATSEDIDNFKTNETSKKEDDLNTTTVYTVTKNEVGFTKGDLKLQKVSVTENIAESKAQGSPIIHNVVNPFYSDVHGEVISEPQPISENGESKVKQPQTRIPKFRQAVDRIKKQRNSSKKTDKDAFKKDYVEEVPRRNSHKSESNIPRRTITEKKNLTAKNNRKEIDTLIVKDSKDIKQNNDLKDNNEANIISNNDNNIITVPEDEFDKIYEEIVDNSPTTPVIESILIDKIDDPEKLETSFEEIIHDYEENKIQPIDVSKTTANRKLSKQNSLQNSVEPKVRERRYSLNENNDNDDKTQGKTDLKYITKPKTNIPIKPKDKRTSVTEYKSRKDLTKDSQNIRNQIKPNRKDLNAQKNCPSNDKINVPKEIVKAATFDNNNNNNDKNELSKENSIQGSTENNSNIHNNDKFNNVKVDPEAKNSILNHNQSEMPDSSKLVQNMLSNMDPQSPLKDTSKDIIESETTENVDRNTDNVPATKTDDDMLKRIEGAPRRRSLKSRIAVLRRRKSMEAKNKVDKGDLYPKNVNNDEDSEPTANKNFVENKIENIDDKLEQTPYPDEQKTKQQTAKKKTVQTIPNKTKPEDQIDIDNSEFVNNHEDHVTDDTYKESGINTDYIEEKTNIQIPDNRNEEIKIPETEKTNIKAKGEVEDEDSIPILKGKVSRIISRLDSRQESTKPTVDIKNEIPVMKSFSSRIAMFERQLSKESEIPAIVTKKTEIKYKPRIISEVLKPNIQEEINPNEIRVENKKRESVIIDEDTANNYIEISFVNSPESNITDQTTNQTGNININKDLNKDTDQLIQSENIIADKNDKESNNQVKQDISIEQYLTNEASETHDITDLYEKNQYTSHEQENKVCNTQSDSLIEQTDKTHADNNKNPNLINSNKKSKETTEELNRSAAAKAKSTITSSKSETHLTKYKRDERSNAQDKFKRMISGTELDAKKERSKSVAELDIGNAVKGKVHQMVVRMNSRENLLEVEKKQAISARERPREKSVLEKIALFERKLTPVSPENPERTTTVRKVALPSKMMSIFTEKPVRSSEKEKPSNPITNSFKNKPEAITTRTNYTEEEYLAKLSDLVNASTKYGRVDKMAYLKLSNGQEMPVLSLGTALLNEHLLKHVIGAAIDMGYRALDCAYIYSNEAAVGDAIKAKIDNGTVTREELFITNKLWSTFHRRDLVEQACRASLKAMNLEYFDLYLIHNPMSFKEGGDPIPKIANVLQYSDTDYLDAWYGMEGLVAKGLVKSIGVSNFNAAQVTRVAEKARVKPVINQVECHPYLTQLDLENVCRNLSIKLNCFGVLGSKGTPAELKNNQTPVIEDPLVKVIAAGLNMSPAQLLLRYQLEHGRAVVVKASSALHLWENLSALNFTLSAPETDALDALNQNKRTYSFKGMGDTHKNYPFKPSY